MKTKNLAVIGFGGRGQIYADFARAYPDKFKLAAVADIDETKLVSAKRDFNAGAVFNDYRDFLKSGIKADLVAVATQDAQHLEHAVACLEKGYDLLLEKPVATTAADCRAIAECAEKYNRKVYVCHVLRYTPFYKKVKEIIDSGAVGEVINIHASENVGFWHFAHSYVRGPWRRADKSSPVILAKCCHDMDIIRYLMNEPCLSVNSRGALNVFKPENAPKGSADYCTDCTCKNNCIYNAAKIYEECRWRPLDTLPYSQYDKCVFRCDNDVSDHQVTIMQFANGKTAAHTLTAFSKDIYRDIKVHGTKAELTGCMEDGFLELRPLDVRGKSGRINYTTAEASIGTHCGGDFGLMNELYNELNGAGGKGITYLDVSLESHYMSFAAEKSRINDGSTQHLKDIL